MYTGKRQTHIRNAPLSRTAVSGIAPHRMQQKFSASHRAEQSPAPTSHIRFSAVFRVEQARRAKRGAARAAPLLRHVALSAAAAGVAAAGIAAAVIAGAEDQQKDDDPPPAVAEGAESGLITRHNKTS